MRLVRLAATAAALVLVSAGVARPTAAQQAHRPFHVAVSGGASFVTGEDRDFYKVGFNGQLSAIVPLRTLGFALRADVSFLGVPGRNRSTQTYPGGPDTLFIGDLSVMA
ncbi:MAG TPA: hypothetical protein VFJ74_01220, partial [Gemmatimonadaceae bacterium]|nr:hypothetical protein [Gemmatimonadaceae bacterium]